MSYRLQVPTSYNTAGLRAALASTACDVRLGIGIDSRTALDASNCPVWHGIIRTWDVPWSGILCRAASLGSAFWASGGFSNTNFAAARAILRPDQANSAAIADIAPTQILDYPFSGDAPTLSASPYMQQFLTGWGSAVRGNPWASQQTIARIPWYRHAGGVTTVRFRSYRKTGTDASPTYNNVATPSSVSMAGADGWQFTDMDCGAGTDDPGCGLIEGGTAVVETGTRMLVGPVSYYRGTAGNRTTGFCLAPWGVYKIVHSCLFLLPIFLFLSGWLIYDLKDKEFYFFGHLIQAPDLFAKNILGSIEARFHHKLLSALAVLMIVGHSGAALVHHFIMKDEVMWRMWPGDIFLPKTKK